jgi:hypothetical protein
MIGDLVGGGFAFSTVRFRQGNSVVTRRLRVPVTNFGVFKIAETESPRPQSRVYFNYSFFSKVDTFGGNTGGSTTGNPSFDLHRELIGGEFAFLDNSASVGARVALFQDSDISGPGIIGVSDITFIFKYAFLNDRETGNVLTGGMNVTAPTGRDFRASNSANNPVTTDLNNTFLFQPWVGGILNMDRAYVQGFSAVIIPTRSTDAIFLSNDVALGFRLYQASDDRALTAIIPVTELHVNTPLERPSLNNPNNILAFPNQVILTEGVHFGLWNSAYLTLGVGIPVSGPRPFDYEAIVQFNLLF